ncbi:hypothetical protein E2542_SST08383 [Spatholobus suberectus]|nr:hypothetical protein E2542_SST08383 [Spatholobus suberectus]
MAWPGFHGAGWLNHKEPKVSVCKKNQRLSGVWDVQDQSEKKMKEQRWFVVMAGVGVGVGVGVGAWAKGEQWCGATWACVCLGH